MVQLLIRIHSLYFSYIGREYIGCQSPFDTYREGWRGKKKFQVILHLSALVDNNPKKTIQACFPPIAHMDKTLKGNIGIATGYPICKLGKTLTLNAVVKDSLFEKNSYPRKDLGVTWMFEGPSWKFSLDIGFNASDTPKAWSHSDPFRSHSWHYYAFRFGPR